MGTHDWGVIATTIGNVLAPLKGGGGAPFPATPPQPPIPPVPPGTGDAAGAASEAAREATAALGKIATELTDLDADANARLEAIVASGEAGKAELERVQKDVEAKCVELGPRLETPQGQRELQDYVEQRLGQARTVINEAMATADDNARQTRELTDRYAGVAVEGGGTSGGGTSGGGDTGAAGGSSTTTPSATDPGGPGAGGPGADSGTAASGGGDPAAAGQPAPAAQPTAAANPFGAGMPMGTGMPMGGMGGGIPMGLPSLGGLGGLPSFGGDPMSALSGLGGGGEPPMGFKDDALGLPDQEASNGGGAALTSAHDDEAVGDSGGDGDSGGKGDDLGGEGTAPASATPIAQPADNDAPDTGVKADGAADGAPEPAKTTEVALPDGSTTEARSPVGAAAVRAILNGASVSEGYAQQGVTLPPPGTPVTDPVPPTQLKAGDVGVWKDHMVMALGNKQVLVNGQVQPQESVGSGPDFLGWIDPTKLANPSAQV